MTSALIQGIPTPLPLFMTNLIVTNIFETTYLPPFQNSDIIRVPKMLNGNMKHQVFVQFWLKYSCQVSIFEDFAGVKLQFD